MITLRKAVIADADRLYAMQKEAFLPLLEIYKDYGYSPADEKPEKTMRRLTDAGSDYYVIELDGMPIGGIRFRRRATDPVGQYNLSPVFILPSYQNRGYAKQAIRLAEACYPDAVRFTLDTIKQEEKLRHLYESLGYRPTGEEFNINERMDIIGYEKKL